MKSMAWLKINGFLFWIFNKGKKSKKKKYNYYVIFLFNLTKPDFRHWATDIAKFSVEESGKSTRTTLQMHINLRMTQSKTVLWVV